MSPSAQEENKENPELNPATSGKDQQNPQARRKSTSASSPETHAEKKKGGGA